ncbi:MAG TPA: cbb3-type cytochrome c oxidase subunit I [Vicinamibacterales bacterium]|nr:cbb3-type cytochrome c oxidase subunit I [Vicinamibacterales bacterium]
MRLTDHKTVGLQYGVTALAFLLVGFLLMILMRWQLAWPGQPLPSWLSAWLGEANAPGGIMLPEFYNQLVAMHGSVMVFLAVVPLAAAAFANYFVPAMIGAPAMAFPRLSAVSYWLYLAAGLIMLASFFIEGGAARAGWTSYPPLAVIETTGQNFWLAGIFLLGVSSTLNALNVLVTVVQCRGDGVTWTNLSFFVWSQVVAALLLLLAFPALQAAAIFQLMDRLAATSFFLPTGMVVGGMPLQGVSGGGNPLLWQHLFWFLGHPEVYVLILPAMGIVAEVITTNARRPLWGYGLMVAAVLFMGGMSMVVWAHHMFLSGMSTTLGTFFQVTTFIISIPSVILITSLVLTLWGGSITFNTPMLFALAFLPMFGIGGLTGLPLGLAASDVTLHDTYYVVGHFHYLVAPGTVFALFAGIYHFWPRITGRTLNEALGKIHFWGSFVCMNLIFMPMFAIGLMGVNRRLWDAGASYTHAQPTLQWQTHMTYAAFLLGAFQLPFLFNLLRSLSRSQTEKFSDSLSGGQPQDATFVRRDTGTSAARLGLWLFLASEAMFFASLFSGYVMLRAGAVEWPDRLAGFPWLETVLLIGASAAFGATRFRLIASHALALTFVVIKLATDASMMSKGLLPANDLMFASWYTLTWVHAAHVLAGALWTGWLAGPAYGLAADAKERWLARTYATQRYWLFLDLIWLLLVAGFYVV